MTDDWTMRIFLRKWIPTRAALLCGGALTHLGAAAVFGLSPENPTYGPFKNPFDWPTFWTVEAKASHESMASHPSDPLRLENLKNQDPNLNDKRIRKFMNRLGRLTPPASQVSLNEELLPEVLAPNSANGFKYQHWLKAELLAHAPFIGVLEAGRLRQGEATVSYHPSNESEILQPFDKLSIDKGQDDGVALGDRYQLYEVGPNGYAFASTHAVGHEITPNGIAEIVNLKPHSATARLTTCFGTISRATRASPMIKDEARFPVKSYAGIAGERPLARVIWVPGSGQLPQPFNFVVVDKGVEQGLRLGDHVMLLNQKSGKITDRLLGEGLLVHVESQTATLLVHDVFPGVINTGDFALAVQTPE
jgi:hypothetical protein